MKTDIDSWDPEDRRVAPSWRARQVLNLLVGVEFERRGVEFARGSKTGSLYPVETIDFACGCVAADNSGWISCGRGLHKPLSDSAPRSEFVASFCSLRTAFDAILAEAWRRRGGLPQHYYEYYESATRRPFLAFETWQETHDLLGTLVWKLADLRADLRHIPMEQEIAIWAHSSSSNGLELTCHDSRGTINLSGDAAENIRIVFAD